MRSRGPVTIQRTSHAGSHPVRPGGRTSISHEPTSINSRARACRARTSTWRSSARRPIPGSCTRTERRGQRRGGWSARSGRDQRTAARLGTCHRLQRRTEGLTLCFRTNAALRRTDPVRIRPRADHRGPDGAARPAGRARGRDARRAVAAWPIRTSPPSLVRRRSAGNYKQPSTARSSCPSRFCAASTACSSRRRRPSRGEGEA